MREIFVSELVKDILGPRKGIHEKMTQYPRSEYMTGILQPVGSNEKIPEDEEGAITTSVSSTAESEGGAVQTEEIFTMFSSSLDPKSLPSSMGLSFTTTFQDKINFKICLTWAKYAERDESGKKYFERIPHFTNTIEISHNPQDDQFTKWFNDEGEEIKGPGIEYGIHLRGIFKKISEKKYLVSIYFVNKSKVEEDKNKKKVPQIHDYVFQPQIRIVCFDETEIVPTVITNIKNEETQTMDFLYREKTFLARGHMTSAVWREIDPQRDFDKSTLDYPDVADDIPFEWIDGKQPNFDPETYKLFAVPDVRTEYVPMFSIPSPDMFWDESYGHKPVLEPSKLAEMSTPKELESALRPLYNGYKNWIEKISENPESQSESGRKIIEKCKSILKRIDDSIKMLCDPANHEILLAFAFANKAIDLQYRWSHEGNSMTYRPFQLGFILMSLESIANYDSDYRDVCDLMWVPTGGGKTEAYLVLVAFVIAYRRRMALSKGSPMKGIGTAVITRYTLRLLTIQQFRRTLSVITACELLRVSHTNDKIGWRPELSSENSDFLWGSSQFSLGLWIGGSVTPNDLIPKSKDDDKSALNILRNADISTKLEPAQILNCPCCNSILSVPQTDLAAGEHVLFFTVKGECSPELVDAVKELSNLEPSATGGLNILNSSVEKNQNTQFSTLSLKISRDQKISASQVDYFWKEVLKSLEEKSFNLVLCPFRASRPGYFERFYIFQGNEKPYDFEIFCPNPKCDLRQPWFGATPAGRIHNQEPQNHKKENSVGTRKLTDGQFLVDVQDPFQITPYDSDRIPIPALTVDPQIYSQIPSVIISTVDKFARPVFKPESTTIFGNADRCHAIRGFFSQHESEDKPPYPNLLADLEMPDPPEMIIQDELHLIDGPLGSMVGIYETALDYICSQTKKIKILASTATIKKANEHIQSIFARKQVDMFPPNGINVGKRFFVTEHDAHPLDDTKPGRLYLGVTAPGKGPMTPLKNVYARLAQSAWNHRNDRIPDITQKIDPFWTQTVYFNAIRELAGGLALYRQDIKERLNNLSPTDMRPLDDALELSGRTDSTELPGLLETLNNRYDPSNTLSPDSLFTTSMFGTGVDIGRLGLMIINGQTKTTASYIQSSGRVGREKAGLVVTMLRSSRPRDLSHYEFFNKYHRQLHRFVEAPSVYPFASGVLDRALGPMLVFILRHMRDTAELRTNLSAVKMEQQRLSPQVKKLSQLVKLREGMQPDTRKLPQDANINDKVETKTDSCLDNWKSIATTYDELQYVEYIMYDRQRQNMHHVVLGDDEHQAEHADVEHVFTNAPQSLRDLESETMFEI